MEQRVTTYSEYAISTSVSGIKDIEAQTLDGISVQKIYFQPDVSLDLAIAQIVSATNYIRVLMPAGIQAPLVVQYNASSVPVLQISLSCSSAKRLPTQRCTPNPNEMCSRARGRSTIRSCGSLIASSSRLPDTPHSDLVALADRLAAELEIRQRHAPQVLISDTRLGTNSGFCRNFAGALVTQRLHRGGHLLQLGVALGLRMDRGVRRIDVTKP
jgi:hypothetical protein